MSTSDGRHDVSPYVLYGHWAVIEQRELVVDAIECG
jgi:hypothetical protein